MPHINHSSSNEVINLSEDIHTRIVDVDCGHYHTVALDVNQRIWVWGTGNTFGANLLSFNNNNGGRADNKPNAGQSWGQGESWRYQTSPYNTYDANQILQGGIMVVMLNIMHVHFLRIGEQLQRPLKILHI